MMMMMRMDNIKDKIYTSLLEADQPLTYKQICNRVDIRFIFGGLLKLIMEGKVQKIPDGNLFVYKAIKIKNN
jgi:hypothetical protein